MSSVLRSILSRLVGGPVAMVDISDLPASLHHPDWGRREPSMIELAQRMIAKGASPETAMLAHAVDLEPDEIDVALSRRRIAC